VQAPVANLVDVGFLAWVDGSILGCFSDNNCFTRLADFVDPTAPEFLTRYEVLPLQRAMLAPV